MYDFVWLSNVRAGCRDLDGHFGKNGYERTDNPEQADLVIINTCCVRESAENKIIGKIGQLKNLKEKNRSLRLRLPDA